MNRRRIRSPHVVVVLVTCASMREARRVADALVTQRAAACVNLVPNIRSIFRWQGRVDRVSETLLIIKTLASRFVAVRRIIRHYHSYDVPEILVLPVRQGHAPYLAWVTASVRPPARRLRRLHAG